MHSHTDLQTCKVRIDSTVLQIRIQPRKSIYTDHEIPYDSPAHPYTDSHSHVGPQVG